MLRPVIRLFLAVLVLTSSLSAGAVEIVPSSDGSFLTSWMVAGPLGRKSSEQLLEQTDLSAKPWRAVGSPGIVLDVGRKGRPKKGQSTWYAMTLDAAEPVSAELRLGMDGVAEVYLDGKFLVRHDRRYAATWDTTIQPLSLTAGRHTLLIKTSRWKKQKGGKHWRLYCRILDPDSTLPKGLRFFLPDSVNAQRLTAQASRLVTQRQITRDGYRFSLQLPITGSHPKGEAVPFTATLRPGRRVIAKGQLGAKRSHHDIHLEDDGKYTLVVKASGQQWTEKWQYGRRWHAGIVASEAAYARADKTRFSQATLDSIRFNIDKFTGLVLQGIPEREWLSKQISKLTSWSQQLATGNDPFQSARGDFYRAYRSPYDGNLQMYSVHLPQRYDGSKRWPLVIGMHGIGSGTHYTLRRVLGKDRDKEGGEPGGKPLIRTNMPRLPDYGVLTASAWGYHNSAYWFYGEDDVMRVIDEMAAAYKVDPDRVYLTGLSLGGLGTYHIGHHFPDRFAALGPLGGFSSVKLYRQIRSNPKTSWEKVLVEQRDATTYAENGRHTPMNVVHGLKDGPYHAKAMTNKYAKFGYKYELDIPDMGHDVWQYAYGKGKLVRWMKKYKRPKAPDEVVFKTHSYRYTRAYWTRIGWIADYTRPALLKVRVDKRSRDRVVVTEVRNIRAFTLDLTQPKLNKGAITVEFRNSGESIRLEGRVKAHFRRQGTQPWALAQSAEPPAGHKRPGVSGPLDDVMYDPHTFVVGTSDPAQTDINRRLVAEERSYLRHKQHDIWFPVVDDSQVTERDMREKTLVLYGNPKSNSVLRRFLATNKIPLSFTDNAIVFDGKRYAGKDVGIKMIFPNPYNPKRVFVVAAGVTWRGTLLSRHLPRFSPDFMIYDRRIDKYFPERLLIDRPVLRGGFFNSDWTL